MTTKCTITLTCDVCKKESDNAYSWARIQISGASGTLRMSPDRHYDLCPDCWVPVRQMIYPPKARTVT